MVGLTLILIATVLDAVVAGVRWLWPRRRTRARRHPEQGEPRGEREAEFHFE
jgi:hypothetical protein